MNMIILNILTSGTRIWKIYNNNCGMHYHNNNSPAIEYANSSKFWAVNDKLHRLDGPAIEYIDGTKAWYVNDINYNTELEYWIAVQQYTHEYKDNNT